MSATTPEECDRLFGQHVNAGDLGALLALYEPGCSLVRRDGGVARGHVEIRAVLSRLVAMPARMSTEIVKVLRTGDDCSRSARSRRARSWRSRAVTS
jgi:ketosteroid isomerase-like protein